MAGRKLTLARRLVELEVLEACVADVSAVSIALEAVCICADLTLTVSKVAQEETLCTLVADERTLRFALVALVDPAS